MKSLQHILQKKAQAYEPAMPRDCDEKTIRFLFEKIVTGEYGSQGRAALSEVNYKNETLYLRVSKSVWETEFSLRKKLFLEELNSLIGRDCVKKIVVKRG
jgi:hypothetical protein